MNKRLKSCRLVERNEGGLSKKDQDVLRGAIAELLNWKTIEE